MSYVIKLNTYYNDKGIEIQEEELFSGKKPYNRPRYAAIVTVQVDMGEAGQMPQQIVARFDAEDIVEAFDKAEEELNKEIKKVNVELNEAAKEAAKPDIITPN